MPWAMTHGERQNAVGTTGLGRRRPNSWSPEQVQTDEAGAPPHTSVLPLHPGATMERPPNPTATHSPWQSGACHGP